MPGWLGMALAVAFLLVAVHRVRVRDAPGALMAVGMGAMAPGMAGIGPMWLHGPWWALGFVAVAVWPVLLPFWPQGAGPVCGGALSHLLGGAAMLCMCLLPMSGPAPNTALTGHVDPMPGMTGMGGTTGMHDMADMHGMTGMAGTTSGASGAALALLTWALACYFLLGTITALTRRGARTRPGTVRLGEAVMGFGTVVMLVTMA